MVQLGIGVATFSTGDAGANDKKIPFEWRVISSSSVSQGYEYSRVRKLRVQLLKVVC